MPPRSAVQFSRGGDTRRALETLIRGELGQGEHYVYVHRGAKDEVFYVGKGRGNRAHSRDRLDLWHHYVQTRCNASHEVGIVKRLNTEAEALDFEGDLISLFGEHTVNWINSARRTDYMDLASFHALRSANHLRISSAADLRLTEPKEAEEMLRKAIAAMAGYARLEWESGLLAELQAELSPSKMNCHLTVKDLKALNILTGILKIQLRWRELINVTDEFFAQYPEMRLQVFAQQIVRACFISRFGLKLETSV